MNNDYLIWIIIFFIFLIIFGLYLSEFTPLNLNKKELTLKNNYNDKYFNNDYLEGFSPRVSSYSSQSSSPSLPPSPTYFDYSNDQLPQRHSSCYQHCHDGPRIQPMIYCWSHNRHRMNRQIGHGMMMACLH